MIKEKTNVVMRIIMNLFMLNLFVLKMILQKIGNLKSCTKLGNGGAAAENEQMTVKAIVVITRKNVLGFTDFIAFFLDAVAETLGGAVSFQLVSATVGDPNNKNKGIIGEAAYLKKYICNKPASMAAKELTFEVELPWEERYGIPGAIIVKNKHRSEFHLKSISVENFPEEGRVDFVCNSWVYPVDKYTYNRIFFSITPYLPEDTPAPLKPYRDEELLHLRGEGVDGPLQEWHRVYDYAFYNDFGNPDQGSEHARPVLGGSLECPYPRRCKTGRPPTKTDPNTESKLPITKGLLYVPRDERFNHLKMAEFFAYFLKAGSETWSPLLNTLFASTPDDFDSFKDFLRLYEGGLPAPDNCLLEKLRKIIPFDLLRELFHTETQQRVLQFPPPQVIQDDKWAWQTDEEFAREMLAGVNPVIIRRLDVFPPTSQLDPSKYGNQESVIRAAHIKHDLDGLTIDQALRNNRLFILDHHDILMIYLNRINSTSIKLYATRTVLFLKEDSTLKPLAIELSLPHPDGEQYGCVSKVYTPALTGVEGSIWQLAKAYVLVNDSGIHQLISHWLNTHAAMEPFVIATNRHLSVLHPLNKLLTPHYRDTMTINALARQILLNADGYLERTVFQSRHAVEMSSTAYKLQWNFVEQALPADLIKRGVAVKDEDGLLHLLIKDYPYAVDGLAIWRAIESWVTEYCSIYYPDDETVQEDTELQAWWKEVREVGHGDLKDEPWWPAMQTVSELTETCSIIIWVASALHAAVNFAQYPYAGYLPNRPTMSRKFMPEEGTLEYEELKTNPEKVFFKTVTGRLQTIIGLAVIEVLSMHSSDEVYLGQRDTPEWTADEEALQAFQRFGERVRAVEEEIMERNGDPTLKNRNGTVKMPYTLLVPTSNPGVTGRGVPNSVSI